jgi:hypothetical protein
MGETAIELGRARKHPIHGYYSRELRIHPIPVVLTLRFHDPYGMPRLPNAARYEHENAFLLMIYVKSFYTYFSSLRSLQPEAFIDSD